ncbi:MFS general substrate transporter [Gautieria morchelliformis]|nr:MFS general substrate transporter [Gautieria morchelliformis]
MTEIVKVPSPDSSHLNVEKPPVDPIADTKHVDEGGAFNTPSEYPDGGLRAWLIVAAAVCVTVSTFGVVNSFVRVFQAYYSQTLLPNSSVSALSWIGSVQYALTFFPNLVTGRLFDLGYFRLPMFIFSVTLVACTFLTAECTQYWQFLLCQGFALGLSTGVLFGPTLSCVAHWFKRRRATAYGVVATGSSIGGTVFPILVRNLIPLIGFPWAMRILGFIVLLLVGFANMVLRRRLPPVNVSGGLFNPKAFKYMPFTVYVLSGFFCFLGPYRDLSAVFYGVSPTLAFYLVAIANASSLLGRIASGVLSDHFGPLNILIPMTTIAGILTMAWPYAKTSTSLIIIAVLYGISSGTFVGILVLPVTSMGEIGDIGRRQGMLLSLLAIGAILGPPISGFINAATRGYVAMGFYAGGAVLAGVVLMFVCRVLITGQLFRGKV